MKLELTEKRINKKLNLFEILTHFQTAAVRHGINLGFGFNEMLARDMYWVLLRTKFIVLNDIESDNVDIVTYPKEATRVYTDREYIIKSNNEILVEGIARWTVINSNTRKLIRSSLEFPGTFVTDSIYDGIDKIVYDENKLEYKSKYKVLKSDLDDLNHMNNVYYVRIIESVYNTDNIKEFQIDYLNEIRLDEEIDVYMYQDEEVYIVGKKEEKICFAAKIKEN